MADARWAWLCGYHPGALRSSDLPGCDARWPWLCAALQTCGGSNPAQRSAPALDTSSSVPVELDPAGAMRMASEFTALALVKLEAGSQYEGPLTPWPPEVQAQHEWLGKQSDAYSVKVAEVHEFLEPQRIFTRQDARGQDRQIQLRAQSMVFKPAALERLLRSEIAHSGSAGLTGWSSLQPAGGSAPRGPRTAGNAIHTVGSAPQTSEAQAVLVPAPLARLVLQGWLREVVLLGRWPRLWQEFPGESLGPEPAALARGASSESESVEEWKLWHSMVNHLREFAPSVLQQHGGQARQPLEQMLVKMESVDCLALAFFPCSGTRTGLSNSHQKTRNPSTQHVVHLIIF